MSVLSVAGTSFALMGGFLRTAASPGDGLKSLMPDVQQLWAPPADGKDLIVVVVCPLCLPRHSSAALTRSLSCCWSLMLQEKAMRDARAREHTHTLQINIFYVVPL